MFFDKCSYKLEMSCLFAFQGQKVISPSETFTQSGHRYYGQADQQSTNGESAGPNQTGTAGQQRMLGRGTGTPSKVIQIPTNSRYSLYLHVSG